uniref:Uncharacterized protein n=1 Tax=uncultured marine virus TaxID=186617 RepID=A0A0F7L366_9VIRU|nr:hypothetical protein [uncultured marine virus]
MFTGVPTLETSPPPATVCQEEVPSPSSRRYLLAPTSPVDRTAVPSTAPAALPAPS